MSETSEQPLPFRVVPDARRDAIHRALLAGLLGNVATKTDRHEFTGARGVKLAIHPGSGLHKNQPPWVVAAELVETTRLYARTVARVQPLWVERAAAHLLKRSYTDPRWDEHSHHVRADEKVTLFGLVLVPKRGVNYGPIDPKVARQLFILHGLVDGRFRTAAPFFRRNHELVDRLRSMEAQVRRRDLVVEPQQLFGFYDARLPAGVFDGPSFETWFRHAEQHHRHQLLMSETDALRPDAPPVDVALFPDSTTVGPNRFRLDYAFDPTSPADGVTVTVPLAVLNQLAPGAFDWLVPGWLTEKVMALIRSLPRAVRTRLIPAPEVAARVAAELRFGEGGFLPSVADRLGNIAGEVIAPSAFDLEQVPSHLKMIVRVVDESGKTLAASRDLAELRERLAGVTREAFRDLPRSPWVRDDVRRWDFGDLPESVQVRRPGVTVLGYPALVEEGEKVHLRLLDSPQAAVAAMRRGTRRLFMQQLGSEFRHLSRTLHDFDRAALHFAPVAPAETLRQSMLVAIADRALFGDGPDVILRQQDDFTARAARAWERLSQAADTLATDVAATLEAFHAVSKLLAQRLPDHWQPAAREVRQQVARLVTPDFVLATPPAWLGHLPRFLRAAEARLKKLAGWGAAKDAQLIAQVRPFVLQYEDLLARRPEAARQPEAVTFRWMIEELRVSLFAQELKTSIPVSPQRLEKQWAAVRLK